MFKRLLKVAVSEEEDALHLYNVFDDGSSYLTNGIAGEDDDSKESTFISYGDIISYKNWKKE